MPENNLGNFLVSSPGKVILFGEHAVVHGQPAIAASVSIRAYMLVSKSIEPGYVELDFPDIGFSQAWRIEDLPWALLKEEQQAEQLPKEQSTAHEMKIKVEQALNKLISPDQRLPHAAAFAFLYLYLHLCTPDTVGRRYCVRSMIPVGAGLGSSAAFSVCVATALLKVQNIIKDPLISSAEDKAQTTELISKWSYVGEVCIHKKPSGIDNAVTTRGGAVYFKRPDTLIPFGHFPELRLILCDTKVPRVTAELVAHVTELKLQKPAIVDPILESIGSITTRVSEMIKTSKSLSGSESGSAALAEFAQEMGAMVCMNHSLLSALGVSHPALEQVKYVVDSLKLGDTKLTGAGGGGCAITLVSSSVDEQALQNKMAKMRQLLPANYGIFQSRLGVPGASYAVNETDISCDEFIKLSSVESFERLGSWRFWN